MLILLILISKITKLCKVLAPKVFRINNNKFVEDISSGRADK